MNVRSMLGSLQIPVAVVGAALVAFAVVGVVTMPPPPPESDGFVSGLAAIALYVMGWVGFLVASLGLAIPPGEGYGVTFTRHQRWLFVIAAVAGVGSVVGPFVAFGLFLSNPSLMVSGWIAIMGIAVLALLSGLGWRGVQAIRQHTGASANG